MRKRQTFRLSLFSKLILVFLGAAFALLLVLRIGVGAFTDTSQARHRIFQINIERYFRSLVADIGVPPALENAQRVTRETRFLVRVENPTGNAMIGHELPAVGTLEESTLWPSISHGHSLRDSLFRSGFAHHRFFAVLRSGDFSYAFFTPKMPSLDGQPHAILALMMAATLGVFLMMFLFVRRLLRPIRVLDAGMARFGEGDLDHRVAEHGSAELARLAGSFNKMAESIRDAIRGREQLLADVSHELRSPIARMKVALELLGDSPHQKSLSDDVRELEHVVAMILDSARLDPQARPLELQPCDLSKLAQDAIKAFGDQASRIVIKGIDDLPTAQANPDWTRRVLHNVIDNALKHSAQKDTVQVTAQISEAFIELHVRDAGEGIAPEEVERVFAPFYRVDKSRTRKTGGVGLGLHICRKAMDAMHGTIVLQSTVGKGTTAVLSFRRVS